jgi:hypothetical protein
VILDGPGATAAGLLARGQAWEAPDWWLVVGRPGDVLHERALALMRMTELPVAPVAVEDGTGALLAADLLAAAAALLVAAPPAPRAPVEPDATEDGAEPDDAAEDGAEPAASEEEDPDVAREAPPDAE